MFLFFLFSVLFAHFFSTGNFTALSSFPQNSLGFNIRFVDVRPLPKS